MRSIVLVGAVLFSASTCLAQTAAPPPAAPGTAAQPEGDAPVRQSGPANLCQELLAFMTAPEPEAETPVPVKTAAAAPQQAAPASDSEASRNDATTALAGTAASDEAASAEADTGTNSAQEITGQDGVATDAPDSGGDEAAASGSVEDAPQKESRAAPTPPADVTSTPKESVLTVEETEQLAAANDLEECQKSAREMRIAGVDMPPPLIALAALDLQYQQESTGSNVPAAPDDPVAND